MEPKVLKFNLVKLFSAKWLVGFLLIVLITRHSSALAQNELAFEYDMPWQQDNYLAKNGHFLKHKQLGLSKEEAMKMADTSPTFGVYRDNYFVTGIPINKKVTDITADAAFQISIKHRITKQILPFNTFAYLTYSQKSFWDIYAESSPFRDSNYNPGLGLGKYLFRDNKLAGAASVQVMHESNGRDSIDSRSWNYLSLSVKYYFSPNLSIVGEFWPPFTEFGTNSKDLIDYKGYGCLSANYVTNNQRWWLSADLLPRKGFGNINTTFTAAFRVSSRSTQYLFARFYQGYGESQKDYQKYVINIRIGICIKPEFLSIF
jgi:phospholipase A1